MGIAEGAVSEWRTTIRFTLNGTWACPTKIETVQAQLAAIQRREPERQPASVHGALDDNVHPQNTMQFAYALQQAGKRFQMMIYPRSAHGVSDPEQTLHLRRMMLDFTTQNLLR